MSPALALYLALTSAAAPAARLVLRRRLAAGKEDRARLPERMGHASAVRPAGPLVWFHAASVGEGLSLLALIARLRSERSDVHVLVTSGTITSARLLGERLPEGAVHQFVPLDIRSAVDSFLDHWRPDLAVWTESEVWPRLVRSAGARGIPALLVNARLSARSRRRWTRLRQAASELFSVFAYVQAQDRETAGTLRSLGVPPERLRIAGSFKESAAPLPCDDAELALLQDAIGPRLTWTAASTHPGEERFACEAHALVLEHRPNALLILVPRHPERGDDVAGILDASALAWTRRADGAPSERASVYLADTLGELGLWYRLASVAFVGGSMGGVGGHNPYEPAVLGTPVLHGPDTTNFAAVYDALDAADGARRIATPKDLAEAVLTLATRSDGHEVAERARQVIGTGSEALERALAAILERLAPPTQSGER